MSDAQKYRVKEGATYAFGRVLSERIGKTVVKFWDHPDEDGDILVETVDNDRDRFYVNQEFLEAEFKVGDRVRAESKTNDDVAEFMVTNVSAGYIQSKEHGYLTHDFNFTLLSRKPEPEPLKVGDEVLIDDERIPMEAILVRSTYPMVKTLNGGVKWAAGNSSITDRSTPAKIVWLPEF